MLLRCCGCSPLAVARRARAGVAAGVDDRPVGGLEDPVVAVAVQGQLEYPEGTVMAELAVRVDVAGVERVGVAATRPDDELPHPARVDVPGRALPGEPL